MRTKEAYTKLADSEDYKESAEGKFAKKRLDLLNDKTKLKELEVVYEDLQRTLLIPGLQRDMPPLDLLMPKAKGIEKDN